MYRQLDQMGFQSGEEFVIAVREADALGATLLLGDQDAKVTLRRLSDALGKVLFAPAGTYGTGAPLPAALVEAVGSDGAAAELTRDNVARSMEVMLPMLNWRVTLPSYHPLTARSHGDSQAARQRSPSDHAYVTYASPL